MQEEERKIRELLRKQRITRAEANKLLSALPGAESQQEERKHRKSKVRWIMWISGGVMAVFFAVYMQLTLTEVSAKVDGNYQAIQKLGIVKPVDFVDNPYILEREPGNLLYQKEGKNVAMPLVRTDVDARLEANLGRIYVTQVFTNPSEEPIEAIYVFPLPENSAVDSLILVVGDKRVVGKIKEKEEARRAYEKAKREGKTASLLEQERPNVFTQNVANIMPGDSIRVTLSYLQPLKYAAPYYYFHFPTVVAPRYVPGNATSPEQRGMVNPTDKVPDAHRITPPVKNPAGGGSHPTGHHFGIQVSLNPGLAIRDLESASHRLKLSEAGDKRAVLQNHESDDVPNKDFMLRYRVAGKSPEPHLAVEDGHFRLVLEPQMEPGESEIYDRELVFVVDVSGSMHGKPMDAVHALMEQALKGMRAEDRFRVITFAGATSELDPQALPATAGNREKALAMIRSNRGGGGTEMMKAVHAVFDRDSDPERRRHVLFMTDGLIGNEAAILATIREKLGQTRVFSLGVGSSTNRYLLEGVARVGGGTCRIVRWDGNHEKEVADFYRTLAAPVLTDITLEWKGLEASDIVPRVLPNLYAGSPLELLGRIKGHRGSLQVKGRLPGGKTYSREVKLELEDASDRARTTRTLYARAKVADIELFSSNLFGDHAYTPAKAQDSIRAIGLEYGIVTSYTSLVAILDEVRNKKGEWVSVEQAVELPEGMDPDGVAGHIADEEAGYVETQNYLNLSAPMMKSTGQMRLGGRARAPKPAMEPPTPLPRTEAAAESDNALSGLLGADPGPASVESERQVKAPSAADIDMGSTSGNRSTAAVLRVIRQHNPVLRQVYDKYLKQMPGFGGKVVLKLTVAPNGRVTKVEIVSSTTGVSAFDQDILRKVKTWHFDPVEGKGSDVYTIPFDFAE